MWLGKLVWVITALASLNVGLSELGYGIKSLTFLQGFPIWVPQITAYFVGLAGLISLLMMMRALGACWKGDCSCVGGYCDSGGAGCGCPKGRCQCPK